MRLRMRLVMRREGVVSCSDDPLGCLCGVLGGLGVCWIRCCYIEWTAMCGVLVVNWRWRHPASSSSPRCASRRWHLMLLRRTIVICRLCSRLREF